MAVALDTLAPLLPRIAGGECKLALACHEAAARYDLSQVACTAARSGDGWRLSGQKTVVLDAPSADYFLVSARSGGNTARAGGRPACNIRSVRGSLPRQPQWLRRLPKISDDCAMPR